MFDWTYSDDVIKCAEELMDKINTLGLFSDRVFIEFKKQVDIYKTCFLCFIDV